eukprot:10559139-Alexandrium_andersonii.AAC.1
MARLGGGEKPGRVRPRLEAQGRARDPVEEGDGSPSPLAGGVGDGVASELQEVPDQLVPHVRANALPVELDQGELLVHLALAAEGH